MSKADFDYFGLLAQKRQPSARFGTTDASAGLLRANYTNAMNRMPDADLVLDPGLVSGSLDYFAPLQLGHRHEGSVATRFTGAVTTAEPTDEGIALRALGGASMAERLVGATTAKNVPTAELVHLLIRTGGFGEEQLNVEGLDRLPVETFEVVTPLDGLEVMRAITFAGVRFLPASVGRRTLNNIDVSEELAERFDAPAYALSLVTTQGMYRAEEKTDLLRSISRSPG